MPSQKKYNSRFPPSRIKKIMQTDEDVGKVAAPVPVIISRVLEMFVRNILTGAATQAKDAQARTLQPTHLVLSICSDPRFSFLHETISLHYKPGQAESSTDESGALQAILTASAETPKVARTSNATAATCTPPISVNSVPQNVESEPSERVSQPEPTGCVRPTSAPRGRGRPRGRPPKRPLPDIPPTEQSPAPVIKRPRGRPRNQPLTPFNASSGGKDKSKISTESAVAVPVICSVPSSTVEGAPKTSSTSSAPLVPGLVRPPLIQHSSLSSSLLKGTPDSSKSKTAPPSIQVPVISSVKSSGNGEVSVKSLNGGNPFFSGINISIPGQPSFSLPVKAETEEKNGVKAPEKPAPKIVPVTECTSGGTNNLPSLPSKVGGISICIGGNQQEPVSSISIAPSTSTAVEDSDEDYDA